MQQTAVPGGPGNGTDVGGGQRMHTQLQICLVQGRPAQDSENIRLQAKTAQRLRLHPTYKMIGIWLCRVRLDTNMTQMTGATSSTARKAYYGSGEMVHTYVSLWSSVLRHASGVSYPLFCLQSDGWYYRGRRGHGGSQPQPKFESRRRRQPLRPIPAAPRGRVSLLRH